MKKNRNGDFKSLIKNRTIPIMTLDSRWHELFPEELKTPRIKELEDKVNNLLKLQGKLVYNIKDMKRLKKSLLLDIIKNMDIKNDRAGLSKGKKIDQNKKIIYEMNSKMDKASEKLSELPYQIKEANEELLLESIQFCYERLRRNEIALNEVSEWIKQTREELKCKILIKNDLQAVNSMIYKNLHDILGNDIIEVFDMKNNYEDMNKRARKRKGSDKK